MKVLVVNNAEKERREFVEPVERLLEKEGIPFDTIEYTDLQKMDAASYGAIISSASPKGDDIVDSHARFYRWIRTGDTPFLGICAGHQIVGKLFEAELVRDKEQETGDLPVYVDAEDPIFAGLEKTFLVRQGHNDAITLPKGFVLLAHSDKCKVQVMKHESKPVYTCQFHAEILNHDLILNFVKIASNYPSSG